MILLIFWVEDEGEEVGVVEVFFLASVVVEAAEAGLLSLLLIVDRSGRSVVSFRFFDLVCGVVLGRCFGFVL